MKTITISTGDKDLRDEVGLCEWDEDTYDCVMEVVNEMLKLKGYGSFSDFEGDAYITIQAELTSYEDKEEEVDFLKAVNGEV